ncbi:MAG: Lrp/AsnC family transcriptional regulator [Archaeoglobaceae archaeon]
MDSIDVEILRRLGKNAKTTLAEIANELGIAVSSVHKRVKRLEEEGVIEKYAAIVNPDFFNAVTAFLLVSAEDADAVAEEIKDIPGVLEVYKTLGNFNVVAKVRKESLDGIADVTSSVSSIEGVMMVECIVATRRVKEDVWTPEVVAWKNTR